MEPRLVILSRGPELYSTKRMFEEAEAAGWSVQILDPLRLTTVVDDSGVRVFNKGWPVDCDAVIPRIGNSITGKGVPIVKAFERMGVIVLNKGDGITSSRDKLLACQMMNEKGIPVPITAHVGTWQDTRRAISRVGGTPCVVKVTEGTHGSGVFLAHTEQQARQLVYQMLERDMRPLVQEYIEESHGQDVRAFVVGGEVVASMRRKARGSEFRSNFHLGAKVEKLEIPEKHAEIACRAAETMGLDIAGVDLLESSRGALVLEVNSSPGLEGIEAASGVNVASKIIHHLNQVREQKESRGNSSEPTLDPESGDEGKSEAY
ncbi:MAG: 30S ribosomal protein S6--L-glutamate ligase [Euryarchaeota archaeon]|nr:30S ribosomal protein S6--L-glutamate ligase [Euryarchaeota archaeon]|tara:strand:- start:2592 stop:3548 length:957 start_codon:yes stop_codon:yes gene_type:complete